MIESWVISFSLILARTATFVAMLPIFGGRFVPRMVKLGLAVSLAVLWVGSPDISEAAASLGSSSRAEWLPYGLALGREIVLGAVLGQVFAVFLLPARIAGEFIGQEMGLALGHLTNPGVESSATVLGEVFEMFGVLIFFGLDGHHVMLAALHAAFLRWPIGGPMGELPVAGLVSALSSAQEWGLVLAAPIGACLFLTTVVLALMARAAPQLNILSVGFSLRLGVGLAALVLLMPEMGRMLAAIFGHCCELVLRLI